MTILIGRYAGHVTLNSSATDRIISVTEAEWAELIDRIKRGQLDYTLKPAAVTTPRLANADAVHERVVAAVESRPNAREADHWGDGPGGVGQALHKGAQVDCPAPECG